MAKKNKNLKKVIKLVHKDTGYIYYTRKTAQVTEKLQFKKYNPKTRKKELFIESK